MKLLPKILAIWFLVTVLASCSDHKEKPPVKPNVILFLIDDYGYADISYEGNTQIKTPNIDRIAKNGAHFTRFYQSGAACAPTRASLLTGRYHLSTGVWGVHAGRDFLNRDETTIADVLKTADYTTGAFGKWHSGKTWPYFSWNRGFDVGVHSKLYRYFDTEVIFNNKLIHVEGPITDVIGDQVVRFIEENQDKPFFAYVPFQSIHEPYNCPEEEFRKYKASGYTDHVARLYGMIEVLDDNVGKILDKVEELDLSRNTVIFFLNDDGPSPGFDLSYSNRRMNEQERAERHRGWARELRGGKGTIWEGGSITPFYIRWDGKIEPGRSYAQLSGVIDIFPTILDICGAEYTAPSLPLHGRSLYPLLFGVEPADWKERRYFDNTNFYLIERKDINMERPEMHHIAMHYQNFKLIRGNDALYGGPDSVYYELYDLRNDPKESTNLISTNVDLAARLIPEVESWYDQVLSSGRAFGQAVFEVGNWEEPASPINIDAVLEVKGSVGRSEGSAFRYEGWDTPGSGMSFEIDVVEDGKYKVELGYRCAPEDLGAGFVVFTQYDTAKLSITSSSSAVSDPLSLSAGRQILHVELSSTGTSGGGIDVLNSIIVHRIPDEQDEEVIRDARMSVGSGSGEAHTFNPSSATTDFMFGGLEEEPLEIRKGEAVEILFTAANEQVVDRIILYEGMQEIDVLASPPFRFVFTPDNAGLRTLNIAYISKSGIANAIHGDILVKEE